MKKFFILILFLGSLCGEEYIYHMKRNLQGDTLYPLNQLKEMPEYIDVYERCVSKYKGREWLLEVEVPIFNCLWNDVLFFSPVHPRIIYEALYEVGIERKSLEFFKIPISDLDSEYLGVWLYPPIRLSEGLEKEYFFHLDAATFIEQEILSEDTWAYFKKCHDEGANPFLFVHVPHILYYGTLNVSEYETIDWLDPIEVSP